MRLETLRKQTGPGEILYLVGLDIPYAPAEAQWCRELLDRRTVAKSSAWTTQAHADQSPVTGPRAVTALCDECNGGRRIIGSVPFLIPASIMNRHHSRNAHRHFAAAKPQSPALDRLSLFKADGAEQEAAAIDIQVRRWLIEGKRRVGIVTENRRLARRVRALLERAGLPCRTAPAGPCRPRAPPQPWSAGWKQLKMISHNNLCWIC